MDHVLAHRYIDIPTAAAGLAASSSTSSVNPPHTKLVFTNRIAKELPLCTVVVDHEDGDLVSYNRQTLHAYYATLRVLCEHSPAYARLMCTHSNFMWAFRNIFPFYAQYPQAAQELNRCIQLFVNLQSSTSSTTFNSNEKAKKNTATTDDEDDKNDEEEEEEEEEDDDDDDEDMTKLDQVIRHFKVCYKNYKIYFEINKNYCILG